MAEENHRVKMTRNNVNLTKEDNQIEEREWKISSHDILHPVPVDMATLGTSKAIAVSQDVVIIQTLPTQWSSPVQGPTHVVI